MWISLTLLQGACIVGSDTFEILQAQRTEGGIRLLLDKGSLELKGQISEDLEECAKALTLSDPAPFPQNNHDTP